MGIIIDLIILAIFVVCILIGYVRGLTGCLIKIISFVLALVVAFILFKPISNVVIDKTNWDESLEQAIRQMAIEENEEGTQTEEKKGSLPDVIMDYINNAVEQAGEDAKSAIIDSTARSVAVTIINAGVLVSLFLISRIILIILQGILKLITKLPVIKQFDKLGGIIYGLVEALIITYIILAIISFISPMIAETGIIKGIQDSFAGSMLYNNNLLLKIIF